MNNDNQALIPAGMLSRIIHDKQQKITYYDQLSKMTADYQHIELINSILFDERNHLHMFMNLYTDFFSEKPDLSEPEISQITSFIYGIKKMNMVELDSYDLYSNIFFTDTNIAVRDVFARALNAEIRHAAKCNFIYTQLVENNSLKGEGF